MDEDLLVGWCFTNLVPLDMYKKPPNPYEKGGTFRFVCQGLSTERSWLWRLRTRHSEHKIFGMATDKRTRLLTHQSIGGISLFVTRNRHRHTSGSSGPFTSNDVSIRAAHRQWQAARNSGLLRSAVLCIRTGNARSSLSEIFQLRELTHREARRSVEIQC